MTAPQQGAFPVLKCVMPDFDLVMPDLIGHLFSCCMYRKSALHSFQLYIQIGCGVLYMGQMAAGGRSGACPPTAICPPFEVRMVASIVVRTKIAQFGPGQFKFVLATTMSCQDFDFLFHG